MSCGARNFSDDSSMKPKFIFFGSPLFARVVLEELVDAGFLPSALVCNPDRPFGRKKVLAPPDTKAFISKKFPEVPILQPEDPNDTNFIERLKSIHVDIFVVAAYAKILKPELLSVPASGVIGVHPSFLPLLRGSSPIQGAILQGFTDTGVTLYLIDELMDHGPVIAKSAPIEVVNKDFPHLLLELAHIGGKLTANTLLDFAANRTTLLPQDHNKATFTKKFKTEDGFIPRAEIIAACETGTQAEYIARKILALSSEPGCYTTSADNRRIKLLGAQCSNGRLVVTSWLADGMHKPSTQHLEL